MQPRWASYQFPHLNGMHFLNLPPTRHHPELLREHALNLMLHRRLQSRPSPHPNWNPNSQYRPCRIQVPRKPVQEEMVVGKEGLLAAQGALLEQLLQRHPSRALSGDLVQLQVDWVEMVETEDLH